MEAVYPSISAQRIMQGLDSKASLNSSILPLSSKGSLDTTLAREAPPHYESRVGLAPSTHQQDRRSIQETQQIHSTIMAPPQAEFIDRDEHHVQSSTQSKTTYPPRGTPHTIRALLWTTISLLMVSGIAGMTCAAAIIDSYITLKYSRFLWKLQGHSRTILNTWISGVPADFDISGAGLAIGAGATAVLFVGFGGIGALVLHHKPGFSKSTFSKIWYHTWLVAVVASTLLSFITLVYLWTIYFRLSSAYIDESTLLTSNSNFVAYPYYRWEPLHWLDCVVYENPIGGTFLMLHQYARGYMFNSIVLFILSLGTLAFTVWDGILARRFAREQSNKV